MVEIRFPERERLEGVNDYDISDFPRFAPARRDRSQPTVDDVAKRTIEAIESITALDALDSGAEVAITAGSRGIHDIPALLQAAVGELKDRGLQPFILPAMGSHGGATADGQVETLAALGITEETMGCEIRSSMDVRAVETDSEGWPVYASVDALEADAIVLANRVKLHTDYRGPIESGLCKMAVVGLGKHRGAESMHNAALTRGFEHVIPERAEILVRETDIVGGVALVENASERAAHIKGVPAADLLDQEPELLDRSEELFPQLPTDDLDLLIVDEMGKNISGTGLDTNVLGRYLFHGQEEPETPDVTRIYVRSLTEESHGNALGIGLADFAHRGLVESVDLEDMYVNIATSGEPARARLPFTVPCDTTALIVAASMTGVRSPEEMRVARIVNTLEPDTLLVSEPLVPELEAHPEVTVGDPRPLEFTDGGDFVSSP